MKKTRTMSIDVFRGLLKTLSGIYEGAISLTVNDDSQSFFETTGLTSNYKSLKHQATEGSVKLIVSNL